MKYAKVEIFEVDSPKSLMQDNCVGFSPVLLEIRH